MYKHTGVKGLISTQEINAENLVTLGGDAGFFSTRGISDDNMAKLDEASRSELSNIQYEHFVEKLLKADDNHAMRTLHAAVGLSGESGEVLDMVKKHFFYGKDLDKNLMLEELGDVMFYFQALINLCGLDIQTVVLYNKIKLNKRFNGTKFDAAKAIAQADHNE